VASSQSQLASAFGGTRSNMSGFNFPAASHPDFSSVKAKPKSGGFMHGASSFLGHLVGDIHAAAVGLPMGLIQTAEHPIRAVEQNAKMTWRDWSPLFHGQYGQWAHNFDQHPLQPIMDVVSVATLPFAGAGAALKATQAVADAAGAVDTADRVGLMADVFRPQSREIDKIPGAPKGVIHYHGNPLIRARQKAVEKVSDKLLRQGDMERQARYLDRKVSERGMATNSALFREFRAAKELFKSDSTMAPVDVVKLLRPHIRQQLVDHAFTVDAKTAAKLDTQNFKFLSKDFTGKEHFPADKSPKEIAKWLETQGANNTTLSRSQALQNAEGQYLVVRRDGVRNYLTEGRNSYGALHALWTKPTQVWKWLVLATAPRYFVNNTVGNMLMYAMSANPLRTSQGLYHVMADTIGQRVARRGMTGAEKAVAKLEGNWQDKWYLGSTGGFISEVTQVADGNEPKVPRGVKGGLYGVTHKVSDELPRRMALSYIIKRNPDYQKIFTMYRRQGKSALEAHRLAADEASAIPYVRDWATEQVNNIVGQYHHFSPLEDKIRTFVPFYSWMRGITRHTMTMASERPAEAAYLANMGQQGVDQTRKELGKIPSFMEGYIPLPGGKYGKLASLLLGGPMQGRKKALSTQGLNPYSSFGDVADIVGSAVSGKLPTGDTAFATSLLPTVQAGIEHVTGQSLLTGAKIQKHGGFVPDVLYRTYENTPQGQILQTALNGTKKPKVDKRTGKTHGPLLFQNDLGHLLRSYIGVPVKDESPTAAASMANKEAGISSSTKNLGPRSYHIPKSVFKTPSTSTRVRKPRTYRVRRTVRSQTSRGLRMHGLGSSSFRIKNELPKAHISGLPKLPKF